MTETHLGRTSIAFLLVEKHGASEWRAQETQQRFASYFLLLASVGRRCSDMECDVLCFGRSSRGSRDLCTFGDVNQTARSFISLPAAVCMVGPLLLWRGLSLLTVDRSTL